MAKGKYGSRAAKTRDLNELQAEVSRLALENETVTEKLASVSAKAERDRINHDATVARLREDNKKRTNGEIEAAKEMQSVLQGAVDAASSELAELQSKQKTMVNAVLAIIQTKLGVKFEDAVEMVTAEMSGRNVAVDWDGNGQFVGGDPDRIKTLQKVRHQGRYMA